MPCFFVMRNQSGLSAPNPDQGNFSRKVSWNFKSFRPNKAMYFGGKFFCLPFLSRKVGRCKVLWHTFLRKKSVLYFHYYRNYHRFAFCLRIHKLCDFVLDFEFYLIPVLAAIVQTRVYGVLDDNFYIFYYLF